MYALGVRGDKAALPMGASPTRQALQPEATEAAMEVTKWLKPSDGASRMGDGEECAGRNVSERDNQGESVFRQRLIEGSHEQVSADTPNAVTSRPGPGGP
jgi:hypothetical protein